MFTAYFRVNEKKLFGFSLELFCGNCKMLFLISSILYELREIGQPLHFFHERFQFLENVLSNCKSFGRQTFLCISLKSSINNKKKDCYRIMFKHNIFCAMRIFCWLTNFKCTQLPSI